MRLNVGCGLNPAPGWLNLDWRRHEGVDLCCDVRKGMPLADRCVDYAVAIHFLQDLAWADIPAALGELHRVLRPGGVLRLGLPDLQRAIEAYQRGDAAYFYVPDADARSLGAKLVTQIVWYGSVRTPFTFDFAHELLRNAGYSRIARREFRQTGSEHAQIVDLDNRERESLFVEAVK
jgi:SAM-dependent methyltransferase